MRELCKAMVVSDIACSSNLPQYCSKRAGGMSNTRDFCTFFPCRHFRLDQDLFEDDNRRRNEAEFEMVVGI